MRQEVAMSTEQLHKFSPEEYLAFERASDERHEYIDGYIYAMVGGTKRHGRIQSNILSRLFPELRAKDCWIYASDLRVRPKSSKAYFYPDLVIECGESAYEDDHDDTLLNPLVIFEIQSPSTTRRDPVEKLFRYQRIPSLQSYLMIEQDAPRIEHYQHIGSTWQHDVIEGLDAVIELPSVGCTLRFAEVYQGLKFDEEDE
jgi:Uma2 family endonuclease